jgi:hypothetical protein|tara:strand:- start:11010 stop:11840 length:831 start_codon:yes stop_codon:yes gene_type:complete
MNKSKVVYWLFIIFIGSLTFSCKVQEKNNVKLKIKTRSPNFLVKKLKSNEFQFETISAKAAVSVIDSADKKKSFKTHIRIRKDSVIWMSITSFSIEAARVTITKDSVKFINRLNKEYFIGDFSYINRVFGTDLDYQMMEALLIGNSLDFDVNERVNSRVDRKKELYYLGTVKKRKVKKELKKEKVKIKGEGLVLWLDPISFKVRELLLTSPGNHRSLAGAYSDYKEVEEQLIPFELRFLLKATRSNTLEIKYSKFSSGKSLAYPFKISSKYVQIQK